MEAKEINQVVEFKAPASKVYGVLVNAELFEEVTGAPAQIDPKVGGAISLFGGMIEGKNLELNDGRLVKQSWRPKNWPADQSSEVRFELSEKNGVTTLTFQHSGFPAEHAEHLASGWVERYWNPMKSYFAS